jgi:hypothetical protein
LRNLRSELTSQRVATLDVWPGLESGSTEVGGSDTGGFDWQEELRSILRNTKVDTARLSDRLKEFTRAHAHGRYAESRSRAERARAFQRDPRVVHAIATEFLSAYELERQGLRAKFMRALLGPHEATDMIRRSR